MKLPVTFLFILFLVLQVIDISYSQSIPVRRSANSRSFAERNNKTHYNNYEPALRHSVKSDPYKLIQERIKNNSSSKKPLNKINDILTNPEWAVRYASGLQNNNDLAYDLITDNEGNVYIAGEIASSPYGMDYALIKYNSSGDQQWLVTYDGGGDDVPAAIAIDGDNNLYVTGQSQGTNETGSDIATVKFNSSGIQQWVTKYESAYDEDAINITLDAAGNIFIIGSYFSEYWDDYLTIKYNSSGQQEWVKTYNGPVDFVDFPTAIVTDAEGNAYVTGLSYGSSYNVDWLTFKFSPTGEEMWSVRFNGTANGDDYALAMAIDDSSNLYITGSQNQAATSDDYMTIKYDSDGNQKWSAVYNGTGNQYDHTVAIGLDGDRNVIVLGISYGPTNADYATVKYNPAGIEQWVERYDGPGNQWDYPSNLSVDNNNNIIVSGTTAGAGTSDDFTCIKYNSAGAQQWIWRNNSCPDYEYLYSMTVDASGNTYATGYNINGLTLADFATVKLNSSGDQQWFVVFDGPKTSYDDPFAMTVDNNGNTYVTGRSQSNGSYDYITVKYNNAGVLQWSARYNGPGNGEDYANAIAVDADGNVYVTGSSDGETSRDFATIKYNSNGIEQWVMRYDGPGNDFDEGFTIETDPAGNIYVSGRSPSLSGSGDYLTIKYDASGNQQWIARYDGEDGGEDYVTSMVIDNSGNIIITGRSNSLTTMDDYLTIKYDSDGNEMWTARYDGGNAGWEWPEKVTVDGPGNLYVTGCIDGGVNSLDLAVVKYNSDGVLQWDASYNGPVSYEDVGNDIVVDASGNIFTAGYTYGELSCDLITVKYSPEGVEQWATVYDDPYSGDDFNFNILLNPEGGIYVSARVYGNLGMDDIYIVRYNQDGEVEWETQYNGPVNTNDFSVGMGLDASGNIYTAGRSDRNSWAVISVLKYANPFIPVELTSFTAKAEDGNVVLRWSTATETNNRGFEVQRWEIRDQKSELRGQWEKIGFVEGNGTTAKPRSYSFEDNKLTSGTYSYRLKQIDFDGSFNYSNIVEVNINTSFRFTLSQNYPNPFNPATRIAYTIPEKGRVKLAIYNALGQMVAEAVNENKEPGNYEVSFNAGNLSSGVYYYKITVNDYSAVRKMILLR